MTMAVESVELLMGLVVCGMAVCPSTGMVLCHLCGEEAELLPLDSCFVSSFGLGQRIWTWYPSLSSCSRIGLGGSSAVHFSAVTMVSTWILDQIMSLIPYGSGCPSLGTGVFLVIA